MAGSPEFSGLGTVLAALVLGYLVLVEPWLGRSMYGELRRHREDDPGVLVRMYGRWSAILWALAAAALLAVAASPDLSWAQIGLRLPEGWSLEAAGLDRDPASLLGLAVGAGIGLAAVVLVGWLLRRTVPGWRHPGLAAVDAMLPRTPGERWAGAGMAVTAGVCEEIVFRGLLIALGTALGLPLYAAAALSLAVFVLGHLYQGGRALPGVALAGLALTVLYLRTDSLLVPILLHVLIDLRSLAFSSPAQRPEPLRASATIGTGNGG